MSCVNRSPKARLPTWSWFWKMTRTPRGASLRWALPAFAAAKCRRLALIGVSLRETSTDQLDGIPAEVGVIAVRLAGEKNMESVMDVVIPLGDVVLRTAVGIAR